MNLREKIDGAVFGLAFGDAYGYRQEFKSFENILAGGAEFPHDALISDDTQMALYLLTAIRKLHEKDSSWFTLENHRSEAEQRKWANETRIAIMDQFTIWEADPRNTRAPGLTCLAAVRNFNSLPAHNGLGGTVWESMGNGTVMRAPWLGLLPFPKEVLEHLAWLSGEVTHGHVEANPAAVLTVLLSRELRVNPSFSTATTLELYDWAIAECNRLSENKYWEGIARYEDKASEGFIKLRERLIDDKNVLPMYPKSIQEDISAVLGEGNIAPESFLIPLAVLGQESSAEAGIQRLVYSNGDSDTIAAIGGAFIGNKYGYRAFPEDWYPALEPDYRLELKEMSDWIHSLHS